MLASRPSIRASSGGLAPIGIGDTDVGGGDRERRPGAQPERLAERHLASDCHRGAALDGPFLQWRGDEQKAGDRDNDEQQDKDDADEQLAHVPPRAVRRVGSGSSPLN